MDMQSNMYLLSCKLTLLSLPSYMERKAPHISDTWCTWRWHKRRETVRRRRSCHHCFADNLNEAAWTYMLVTCITQFRLPVRWHTCTWGQKQDMRCREKKLLLEVNGRHCNWINKHTVIKHAGGEKVPGQLKHSFPHSIQPLISQSNIRYAGNNKPTHRQKQWWIHMFN
jgi:hypothetical protein